MVNEQDEKTVLDKFIEDIVKIINKHADYVIVGGFIAIAHGRSRATEDIDMIIEPMSEQKFAELHKELLKSGFECIQGGSASFLYRTYLLHGDGIRYVRKGEFIPQLELKFAKDKLDEYTLKTKTKLPFTGLDVYFANIETTIAFKEELLGSRKDIEDAKHLRIVYEDKLNDKEIEKIKKMIRLVKLGKNGKR